MRKKDFIRLNKKREKKVLEQNRQFYDKLVGEKFGKKKAPKKVAVASAAACGASGGKSKSHKIVFSSAIAVFLCLTMFGATCIATGFFGLFNRRPAVPPADGFTGYSDDDRLDEKADIADTGCSRVTVTVPTGDFDVNAIRCFDEPSNDTLYYRLSVESSDTPESLYVNFYPNEKFKGVSSVEKPRECRTLNGIEYGCSCESKVSDGIRIFDCMASAALDGLKIYVTYTELTTGETSNFFNLLGSTLSLKA